ncbi:MULTISPECIES: ShlB/FhaC/HecB family hemolysin secretion/activation protein [Mesorhizobium]|uniref:ShlB/FhaC/HecB family hemolysin secretion/activation protein n=1 Tax=Mesorhizobium denitrificans TaxID=2294114 RepID=A0A371XCN0_9HYPH|nr:MULTISPECIES: ShlB/FhaC/HecB family hemolysin secretion/activation protein [Mesorhizobium]RFC66972.1 ShlB/FhaC/HecB family hemolysin secretion/activation protein [Mesorhizobium denitrificans]
MSAFHKKHRLLALSTVYIALTSAHPAFAQTASQIVPPSYAPPTIQQGQGGIVVSEGTGLATPKGAEALKVKLSGLAVSGGLPALQAETKAIEQRLTSRQVSGADLFAAARDLETAYARAGYILVRVSLPPQTVRDGESLKLVVTNGQVEKIDASALPERARKRVEAILSPLVNKPGVTKAELERKMLLAGDVPGLMLRSTLKAGETPGSTVIAVDGKYNPVTFTTGVDNGLSDELGDWSANIGANLNNVLGLGEVTYLRLSGYPGFDDSIFESKPRNRQIAGGVILPLGIDGLWLNLEGVDSRTHPKTELALSSLDHYSKLSARLGYSWVRSRNFNTSTVLSFDATNEKQQLDVGTGDHLDFSEDRVRALRFTQNADTYFSFGGFLSGSATLSLGLDALGARHATAALPLSREGAEPDFTKFEVELHYNQSFASDAVRLSLAGKAQTSFGDPLVSSEQMGLGGFNWLSAYESGAIQGDSALVARGDLAFPLTRSPYEIAPNFGATVVPYVFAAAGLAKLENPTALEEANTHATSFGAGVHFGLGQKASQNASDLMLEFAHGTSSNDETENRFNIRFAAQF